MKKQILVLITLLLFFPIGCSSTKALKRSVETPGLSSPEAGIMADNETEMIKKGKPEEPAEKPDGSREGTGQAAEQKAVVKEKGKTAKEDKAFEKKIEKIKKQADLTEDSSGKKISLNFDNADIYEVINALSDFLGINYIIDPAVKGRVNIHTSGAIDKNQLLSVLETIFDMNNIALVEFGEFYKIVPVKNAKKEIMDLAVGSELSEIPSYDRVMIQIIPVQYVASSDVSKLLKPFLSKGADIFDYKKGNLLIVVDTAASIKKLLKLIDIIDVDVFENINIRFFKIKNAEVKDVSKELESIFSAFGIRKTTGKGIGLHFIPIERISCVLAVSSIPGIFEKVEHWLGILDTIDVEAEEQVNIYFVENGKADEIADVLGKIYGKGKSARSAKRQPRKTKGKRPVPAAKKAGSSFIEGEIKIVTDEATNSIIVLATPNDYSIIKETMFKLDIIPKQVLIEVLIAEVTLSGDTQFGIEWFLKGHNASIGGYKGQDSTGFDFGLAAAESPGFTYSFDSNRLQVFLRAQASKNKLNILSSPHILAADNKEARIEVGQEVPIVTSEYIPQDVLASTSTSRSIEYRSTGVILSVTPRINEKGLVAMDITQEVSEAQPLVEGGIQSPIISNRKAETSLVVQDGQTIIIGGLIKEQSSKTITGIPFLSSIPLLSYLFSNTADKKVKTELVILITPHVINSIDEADVATKEFREKLGQIKKLIRKSSDYWKEYN